MSHKAAELRAEKTRMQAEADAAEVEYHRIRFSAGVPGPGADALVTEEGAQFPQPDPQPIITRFAALEDEVRGIEEQVADYNARLALLQGQQAQLRLLNQPRAKDATDEVDRDLTEMEQLELRTEIARRALDTAAREAEEARAMKLQIEQSLSVLAERLDMLPAPLNPAAAAAAVSPEVAEDEEIAASILQEDADAMPSAWAKSVHSKAVSAARKLQQLMRVIDPTAAAAALHAAAGRLQHGDPALQLTSGRGSSRGGFRSAEGEDGEYDTKEFEEQSPSARAPAMSASASAEAAEADAQADRRMDATIDSLILKNEWSIRVSRPDEEGVTRPHKAITGKALSEAVAAFEKTWKDVSSGITPSAASFSPSHAMAPVRASTGASLAHIASHTGGS
jgi:hypothetical protein